MVDWMPLIMESVCGLVLRCGSGLYIIYNPLHLLAVLLELVLFCFSFLCLGGDVLGAFELK